MTLIRAEANFLTRRKFFELAAISGGATLMSSLAACDSSSNELDTGSQTEDTSTSSNASENANPASDVPSQESAEYQQEEASSNDATAPSEGNGSLVLVFSRADENYRVGYIETGNTMVLAHFIQQKTGADLFELKPVEPYPAEYQACIDQALAERDRGDRPAVAELPDLSGYNTIYFGFPVWWGDIPMPVYTAIEALDWGGKTIAPFNTHEGSGDAGMFNTLASVCAGAEVLGGLTVRGTTAQNERDEAEQLVDEWLASLGI